MKTITEFCNMHNACPDGLEWALKNCRTMQDAWDKAKPEWVVWMATRKGVLTDKELRLFAVWSARQVESLLTDQRSKNALDVAERHANGLATDKKLAAARAAARAAADAAYTAARAARATRAAARAAARAAYAAARAAARAADAAAYAADAAAYAAADAAAADAAQADWLRSNAKPCFQDTSGFDLASENGFPHHQ